MGLIRTPEGYQPDSLVNGGGGGGLSVVVEPNNLSSFGGGGAPATLIEITATPGNSQTVNVAFFVADETDPPALSFQGIDAADSLATVVETSVDAFAVLPSGLLRVVYDVKIQRDSALDEIFYTVPVLSTSGGKTGLATPVTVILQPPTVAIR